MTVPRLVTLLRGLGIVVSKRQVVRLLINGQDGFLAEARDVLRAGLTSVAWIMVDDTGARHKATNGSCAQIGNTHFAWFGTTGSRVVEDARPTRNPTAHLRIGERVWSKN
jgi:hypothetical protein